MDKWYMIITLYIVIGVIITISMDSKTKYISCDLCEFVAQVILWPIIMIIAMIVFIVIRMKRSKEGNKEDLEIPENTEDVSNVETIDEIKEDDSADECETITADAYETVFYRMDHSMAVRRLYESSIDKITTSMVQDVSRFVGKFLDHPEIVEIHEYDKAKIKYIDEYIIALKELIDSIMTRGHTVNYSPNFYYFYDVNLHNLDKKGIADIILKQKAAKDARERI